VAKMPSDARAKPEHAPRTVCHPLEGVHRQHV
jgi:hypothetical protein